MDNFYIYEIENLINHKKYIGKRHCHCKIEDDDYMGSGVLIKKAIAKYGKQNFVKRILMICDSEQEAYEAEREIIQANNAHISNQYYNLASGGYGGSHGVSYTIKPTIILNHNDYIDEIKKNGIIKGDCHAAFKLRYYIEYLILNNVSQVNIIKKIKLVAKDYFEEWSYSSMIKEIVLIYNAVMSECSDNSNSVLERHTDISISLYSNELLQIKQLTNKWHIRYIFAALVMFKFSSKENKLNSRVPFYESQIQKIAGVRTRKQRDDIWEYLQQNNYLSIYDDGTFDVMIAEDYQNNKSSLFLNTSNYKDIMLCWRYYLKDDGIDICKKCGCPIIQNKNRTKKYCNSCAKYQKKDFMYNVITCIDCNKPVKVHPNNNQTIRCEDCQRRKRNRDIAMRMRKYRENMKK